MTPSPLSALIAEDESLLAEHLKQELGQLWPELRLLPIAPHGQAAVDLALAERPAICFLDIRMPGMTGLEAAAAMAEDWPDEHPFPLLVFVTAYDQYALQAFEHAAVDYVLKPVQRERLAQTVTRLKQALSNRSTPPSPPADAAASSVDAALAQLRQLLATTGNGAAPAPQPPGPKLRLLQVSTGNTIQMVPVDEVLFFEAADKYVRVITAGKEHLVRISLRELLPQLDEQLFWQVHRGTIVRAEAIDKAVRDEAGKLTLHIRGCNEKLSVSRMYSHLFKGL